MVGIDGSISQTVQVTFRWLDESMVEGFGSVLTHVILEILSHGWIIDFDVNAGGFQNFGITDAGKLEELRGLNASGADDDFAFGVD